MNTHIAFGPSNLVSSSGWSSSLTTNHITTKSGDNHCTVVCRVKIIYNNMLMYTNLILRSSGPVHVTSNYRGLRCHNMEMPWSQCFSQGFFTYSCTSTADLILQLFYYICFFSLRLYCFLALLEIKCLPRCQIAVW